MHILLVSACVHMLGLSPTHLLTRSDWVSKISIDAALKMIGCTNVIPFQVVSQSWSVLSGERGMVRPRSGFP